MKFTKHERHVLMRKDRKLEEYTDAEIERMSLRELHRVPGCAVTYKQLCKRVAAGCGRREAHSLERHWKQKDGESIAAIARSKGLDYNAIKRARYWMGKGMSFEAAMRKPKMTPGETAINASRARRRHAR